ncbi:MAG: chorismate synthase [Zetaproteobacteria bacterium CG_4_9_14_3_um_filter_49_83]|nr:MAG: chorismate synthase [Zetaproteobacteria bacterium CG1_02_49_23]PIQ30765.1 MAG: chorismate synthase [Zetaproteobacteria bacterium CG17_big_fil_post_rev_8_21_14_2_50_50_13]PIV29837.1 MAG: chorismate synthase [Zetaproteobacteria bacterium CG02_land_8_20_14_3_00_50_9]PIY56692.1 MAG: chorismate synthase [Zetaproteobacteria bacterium CG_4_10_14_0_8_um_filter_49_80]PJA36254.1 MAG: chorismate synthase [Zetaproteobacteria bacterium CG_4_9_14_3_um_filter_49_83]
MSGSITGDIFRVSTAGESHGAALVAIVDGCPAGIQLSEADIQPDLDRRKPGQSKYTTQRREADAVEILSGVFEGVTTGCPIGLLIRNTDQRSKDYSDIKDKFRPGHADFTYYSKYGIRDYRGGGRSSARETAMRVAAGAIAKKLLAGAGVSILGWVDQIGPIKADPARFDAAEITKNPFFCPDAMAAAEMAVFMDDLRKQGDSIGAGLSVQASGVPAGLGEPVFDRLDADIAKALMNIPATKAVEIGDGMNCIATRGSQFGDAIRNEGFLSNHAGGILGGISNGDTIRARMALKPTSSILTPRPTIDTQGNETEIITKGRHDPCVGIRAVPIAEAMLALVLADHLLRHRASRV